MKWKNGELVSAKIHSKFGNECKLKYREKSKLVEISKDDFIKANSNLD